MKNIKENRERERLCSNMVLTSSTFIDLGLDECITWRYEIYNTLQLLLTISNCLMPMLIVFPRHELLIVLQERL